MRHTSLLLLLFTLAAPGAEPKPDAPDFRVFRADGSPASLDDIVTQAKEAQAVFLGESHDDRVAHQLETEIFKRLAAPGTVLSLEMFERDVQGVLNEYLAGLITEEHLLLSGRPWRNYKADYRPLVELAKEQRIPVIAANAPRRYVNRVSRLGKGSLTELDTEALQSLPPLPYADASPEYAERFHKVMEEVRKESEKRAAAGQQPAPQRNPQFGLEAQSLWDASMAHAIARELTRQPAARIIHVNGSFHTEKKLGIPEHLARYRPGTRTLIVTMRPEQSFPNWDAEKLTGAGDFIILTNPRPGTRVY